MATLAAVTAATVVVVAAMAIYLMRLRRQRDQARWQATHDPLTAAPNRRALATTLKQQLTAGRPVAVAMIDLDRFKTVNDRYGHQAGDQVLVQVAARLARLGPPVVLAARLGGDEFALLITGGTEQALAAGRAAWAALAGAPVAIAAGHRVHVAASIGVAARHHSGITASQLLHHADLAMQQAKTRGGGVAAHTRDQPDQPVTARPTDRRRDRPRH
jgi:diguanylate cyclase (GGDEF)-like protein